MAEATFEIKPIGIKYNCDICTKGEMVYTGKLDLTAEGERRNYIFPHKCNNADCGHEEIFTEKYPTVRYVNA